MPESIFECKQCKKKLKTNSHDVKANTTYDDTNSTFNHDGDNKCIGNFNSKSVEKSQGKEM